MDLDSGCVVGELYIEPLLRRVGEYSINLATNVTGRGLLKESPLQSPKLRWKGLYERQAENLELHNVIILAYFHNHTAACIRQFVLPEKQLYVYLLEYVTSIKEVNRIPIVHMHTNFNLDRFNFAYVGRLCSS